MKSRPAYVKKLSMDKKANAMRYTTKSVKAPPVAAKKPRGLIGLKSLYLR